MYGTVSEAIKMVVGAKTDLEPRAVSRTWVPLTSMEHPRAALGRMGSP